MMGYRRKIHPFINRLKCVWYCLTSKEFIFIEVKRKNKSRSVKTTFRTNDNGEGDLLTIKAAYIAHNERISKQYYPTPNFEKGTEQ